MTEAEWRWVIPAVIAGVVLGARALHVRKERLRREWFDGMTATLSASPEHRPGGHSECVAAIRGRTFIIEHSYVGAQVGTDLRPGWTLRCRTRLNGVPDIYNFRFRRKRDSAVDAVVHGYAPRENWQTPALRKALGQLFATTSKLDTLDAEGGALVFRTHTRYDGQALRAILDEQTAVATALERTL